MCLDFFLCAIFSFWYFDITFLTILSWTIWIHRWAKSNVFDAYKNNRFWSAILILLVFQSDQSPHPISTPEPFQSLSCLCPGSIAILIWSPFWFYCRSVHLGLHSSKIKIPYLVLFSMDSGELLLPTIGLVTLLSTFLLS